MTWFEIVFFVAVGSFLTLWLLGLAFWIWMVFFDSPMNDGTNRKPRKIQ